MENFTLNFFKHRHIMALFILCFTGVGFAQTTVTYSLGNTAYYSTQTTGTSGAFANGAELGMYSNGGGTKNVVSYRTFKTAGDNTGSTRALQVGDVFSLQIYASAAFGQIGFSLNTTNVTTNYGTRNTNSRLYVQEDGTNGSWYVNSSAGNQSLNYNVSSTYRNYLFKVYITSETTCDVELTVDGSTTQRLFNRTMNGAAGANITGFSLYLSDDYNGSANANVYWKQLTEVRASTTVSLGYYLTSGNFTPGKITNGLAANSTSTISVNKLNVGGDSGTMVILNQPNTYTGATTINAGARAELQNAQAFGQTSGVTVSDFGALSLYSPTGITYNSYPLTINGASAMRSVGGNNEWTGSITLGSSSRITADANPGSLAIYGAVTIPGGRTLLIDGTQPVSVIGPISGAGTLAKEGTNTLSLSGINSYSLGTIIRTGTVEAIGFGALGSGPITFPSTGGYMGTLSASESGVITNPITLSSGSAIINTPDQFTLQGVISGSGTLNKTGAGDLRVQSANSYIGGTNIGDGTITAYQSNSLGSGNVKLGYSVDTDTANAVTLRIDSAQFGNTITIGPNTSGASRTIVKEQGTVQMNGSVSLTGTLTTQGNGIQDYYGTIGGSGGLNIFSRVSLRNTNNSYFGNTTINANGILRLENSNVVSNSSNLILNGGTFETAGNNEQMNVLLVESNSTIELGNNSHAIRFAYSADETWSGTLTINNWNGTAGQSNATHGRIMVGFDGLSPEQLALITFTDFPGTPIILPSGELVPPGPILSIAGDTNFGNVCTADPPRVQSYTVTNTGGNASDLSIQLSNGSPDFSVYFPSTAIASGETAFFNVTFTPSGAGPRQVTITIVKMTIQGYVPLSSITLYGTGIAQETYYADADADGFGDAAHTQLSCAVPEGYVSDNTDCNDNNASLHQVFAFYADNDNDGFGAGSAMSACAVDAATAPSGYSVTNTDCNDSDATRHASYPFYTDNDNDGFGGGNPVNACAVNAGTPPAGYTLDHTDCDDHTVRYADADNDGFGNPLVKVACGGVTNSADCNDNQVRYADIDGDGYGSLVKVACGGSLTSTDCDDNNNQVNPGHAEVGYNLIDDDCDGFTDEGFPPKNTTITGAQCGLTLTAIDNTIYADLVAGAQGYQWRITTMSGPNIGQVQLLGTTLRVMKLTQLASYAYNTTYKVEVAVYYAGYLQPYTTSNCTVTTPAITTSLSNCNQTLSTMADVIYANSVLAASGYRFRITEGANTTILDRNVREFRMNLITAFQVKFNKTYSVEVAVKNTDGSYLPYGAVCSVNTPVFPTTSVQDSQCEDYPVPTLNTVIYANSYPGAIAYVFNLSGNNLGATGVDITKTTRSFKLSDFSGLIPGATYSVKVRLIFNYADPAGPFGKTCTVTVPGSSRIAQLPFDAKAYPNPFADSFNIDVTTSAHETINVKVYDMTGRLLETRDINVSDMGTLNIGDQYPSGVYNVILNQGENVKTLRTVKR